MNNSAATHEHGLWIQMVRDNKMTKFYLAFLSSRQTPFERSAIVRAPSIGQESFYWSAMISELLISTVSRFVWFVCGVWVLICDSGGFVGELEEVFCLQNFVWPRDSSRLPEWVPKRPTRADKKRATEKDQQIALNQIRRLERRLSWQQTVQFELNQ